MPHKALGDVQDSSGRGEITDPAILETLLRPSEEAFADIRRLEHASAAALHEMRMHTERYLVD